MESKNKIIAAFSQYEYTFYQNTSEIPFYQNNSEIPFYQQEGNSLCYNAPTFSSSATTKYIESQQSIPFRYILRDAWRASRSNRHQPLKARTRTNTKKHMHQNQEKFHFTK
jgi:hypothetical protein